MALEIGLDDLAGVVGKPEWIEDQMDERLALKSPGPEDYRSGRAHPKPDLDRKRSRTPCREMSEEARLLKRNPDVPELVDSPSGCWNVPVLKRGN